MFTLVVVGIVLLTAELARNKFTWWKDAQFAGRIVAKEARVRETGAVADPDAAIQKPKRYRFFLTIDAVDGAQQHEVTLHLFQRAQPGWTVAKLTGTYEFTLTPPSEDTK